MTAVAELQAMAAAYAAEAAPPPPPGPADPGAVAEDLRTFRRFAEIVERHLAGVCEETEAASDTILAQLGDVEASVGRLIAFVRQATGESIGAAITKARNGMADTQARLEEMSAQREADARTAMRRADELTTSARKVTELLDDVHQIARKTHIISMNAAIQAAGAGPAGRGFAVLAQEVRSLAGQSAEVATRISDQIRSLTTEMDGQLRGAVQAQAEADRDSYRRFAQAFDEVRLGFNEVLGGQQQILADLAAEGDALQRPILRLAGAVQFQDITRQRLGQVSGSMAEVSDHVDGLAAALDGGPAAPGALADVLERMYAGYVMDRQRADHAGAGEAEAAPLIELF